MTPRTLLLEQLAATLLAVSQAVHGTPTRALDSLIESERAFARASVEKGMREAFLAFLADDGVLFRPLPQNGRRMWEARGPVAGTLAWEPGYAEVAAGGDLGYTTGPWEFRPHGDPPAAATSHGHFISVWRRPPKGEWRVLLDIGCSHAKPERGVGSGDLVRGPAAARGRWGGKSAESELEAAELAFARDAEARGFAAAFVSRAAPDVRLYREGQLPRVGSDAAREALAGDSASATWRAQGAGAARSADLGYAYGIRERRRAPEAAPDSSVYLHLWRRGADRQWRVALAVDNPLSKRSP